MPFRFAFAMLSALGVFAVACATSRTTCFSGEYLACTCEGRPGYALCEGSGYLACDCSGTVPGLEGGLPADDASTPDVNSADVNTADAVPEAERKLAYLAACETDAQCTSGLCFNFNMKGKRCTKTCASDAVCQPPSTGCSNKNVCKAP
jgi:hypothetical protein